ncbi:MAG TPA: hypothetical protein VIV58_14660 [Kofleriaceae bacterium]
MPTSPPDMLPPTLEIPRGRLVLFSAFAIASSVVIGVALNAAIRHPHQHGRPHIFNTIEPTRADITLARLHQLAYEAFPLWLQAHPHDQCPRTLEELATYTNTDVRGPSGEPIYTFTCDPKLMPAGVHGIWLRDLGEDEIAQTADDLTSDMTEDDR